MAKKRKHHPKTSKSMSLAQHADQEIKLRVPQENSERNEEDEGTMHPDGWKSERTCVEDMEVQGLVKRDKYSVLDS